MFPCAICDNFILLFVTTSSLYQEVVCPWMEACVPTIIICKCFPCTPTT